MIDFHIAKSCPSTKERGKKWKYFLLRVLTGNDSWCFSLLACLKFSLNFSYLPSPAPTQISICLIYLFKAHIINTKKSKRKGNFSKFLEISEKINHNEKLGGTFEQTRNRKICFWAGFLWFSIFKVWLKVEILNFFWV